MLVPGNDAADAINEFNLVIWNKTHEHTFAVAIQKHKNANVRRSLIECRNIDTAPLKSKQKTFLVR
jgi:hypothetical protein